MSRRHQIHSRLVTMTSLQKRHAETRASRFFPPTSCYVFGGMASTQWTGDCDFFPIYLEWGLQKGGVWCSVSHCNTLHNIAPRCNTLGTSKDRARPYLSPPPLPPPKILLLHFTQHSTLHFSHADTQMFQCLFKFWRQILMLISSG